MLRLSSLLGLSCLTVALIVGVGFSGGEKKEKEPPKKKVQLPPNFTKLGLSDEQKKKVYEVRGNFATKIDSLQEQIEGLKKQEFAELMKLLTDNQRELYRKIVTKGLPDDPTKKKEDTKKQ